MTMKEDDACMLVVSSIRLNIKQVGVFNSFRTGNMHMDKSTLRYHYYIFKRTRVCMFDVPRLII